MSQKVVLCRKVRYLSITEIRLKLEQGITGSELARKSKRISMASVLRGIEAYGLCPATVEAWTEDITPTPTGEDVIVFPGTLFPTPHSLKGVGRWSAAAIQSQEQGSLETSIPLGCAISMTSR